MGSMVMLEINMKGSKLARSGCDGCGAKDDDLGSWHDDVHVRTYCAKQKERRCHLQQTSDCLCLRMMLA